MIAEFHLRGERGEVHVECAPNDDPAAMGSAVESRGFPVCHARVAYPFRGYDSVMGWVQLVRSDDNASGGELFEPDPLEFLGPLGHPFCWLGINPTLFDAPSRPPGVDLTWVARSFLCVPDDRGHGLEAIALLGFSWGFDVADGRVRSWGPEPADASDWDAVADVLSAAYPDWHFPPGFLR